jgi:endonuclease/exonuclease/phosphatase family metal-dependent hydrolase
LHNIRYTVGLLVFLLTGCAATQRSEAPVAVRVMTLAITYGEEREGSRQIERVARVIKAARADIVALQDVDRWTERIGGLDLIAELSERTQMTYAFARTTEHGGGVHGIGLLTRFPILEERHYLFTQTAGGEQYGMMILILDVKGTEIAVINTQFDRRASDTGRIAAAQELLMQWESYRSYPTILLGQLNDEPSSRTVAVVSNYFEDISGTDSLLTALERTSYVLLSREALSRGWRPLSAAAIPTDTAHHGRQEAVPLLVELQPGMAHQRTQ